MDKLWIGTLLNNRVRLYACDTRELTKTICEHHRCSPLASVALGRTLAVAAIMGSMLKDDSRLTIRVNGGGPLGIILVDATSDGKVRGLVGNSQLGFGKLDNPRMSVGEAVGINGNLTVVRNFGMKQNYSTQVRIQTGEIGSDFSFYFEKSEQTPSVVSVGTLVDEQGKVMVSGGWIMQLMPDATEEDYQFVEQFSKSCPSVTNLLLKYDSLEEAFNGLIPGINFLETRKLEEYCNCSVDRFITTLATIPQTDLEEMIEENGCEIICEFCSRTYNLSKDDLEQSLALKKSQGNN